MQGLYALLFQCSSLEDNAYNNTFLLAVVAYSTVGVGDVKNVLFVSVVSVVNVYLASKQKPHRGMGTKLSSPC